MKTIMICIIFILSINVSYTSEADDYFWDVFFEDMIEHFESKGIIKKEKKNEDTNDSSIDSSAATIGNDRDG